MRPWPRVTLGQVLKHRKEFILLDDTEQYKRCRVQLHAKGVVLRDTVPGSDIKTKRQQVCHAGEFLVAEIDAKMGGFGIVPEALEGAVVSSHYFLFAIDGAQLDRRFLDYFIRTTGFRNQVEAQGSTNYAAIRSASVAGYQMPLPPLAEQQAIVSRLDTLADKVWQVNEHLDAIERDAGWLLAVHYNDLCRDSDPRELGALLMPSTEYVALELDEEYEEITIRLWGKGIVSRGRLLGSQIRSARRLLSDNQLVFSKIDVRHGAIGIVPQALAGAVVSNDFPSFDIDNSQITTEFLSYIVSSDGFINRCKEASSGTTNRVRLSEGTFLRLKVPVPPLKHQRTFDALQAKVAALKARHATIRQANDALIPATLERVFN